jgi:hypothetical protein
VNLGDSTVGGTLSASISGTGANYTVSVSGMSGSGQVIATIPAGAAQASSLDNISSTSSDNSVTFDSVRPTVTINQATGQLDPTSTLPVNFTVTFTENVSGFNSGDVSISGLAGTPTVNVSGGPAIYNVAVGGMANGETALVSIPAGAAADAAGNTNTASTSSDNQVTFSFAYSTYLPLIMR